MTAHQADVRITVLEIESPDPQYTCCDGTPATLDVYANGVYFGYFGPCCVEGIPGYQDGLREADIIPNSWDVLDASGALLGRYGGMPSEKVAKQFGIPGGTVQATTAASLFDLPGGGNGDMHDRVSRQR